MLFEVLLKANFKKFCINLLGTIISLSLSPDVSSVGLVERSMDGTFLCVKNIDLVYFFRAKYYTEYLLPMNL